LPEKLNKKLRRDDFMPFAPAILGGAAHRCCLNYSKSRYTANFMNIGFEATEYLKMVSSAVIHKDGSVRAQFVYKENNPSFYAVIKEYEKISKIPVIINTSFNLHDEPIVCSPQDAINSFKKAGLDYLALENFWIKRSFDGAKK